MTKRKARRGQNRNEMVAVRADRTQSSPTSQTPRPSVWHAAARGQLSNVWLARGAFALGLALIVVAAMTLSGVTSEEASVAATEIVLAVATGFIGMIAAVVGVRSLSRLSSSGSRRR